MKFNHVSGVVVEPVKSPERNLLTALIFRSINDILCGTVADAEDSREWLACDDTDSFTYIWCCEQLGFDYNRIRASVADKIANLEGSKRRLSVNLSIRSKRRCITHMRVEK